MARPAADGKIMKPLALAASLAATVSAPRLYGPMAF